MFFRRCEKMPTSQRGGPFRGFSDAVITPKTYTAHIGVEQFTQGHRMSNLENATLVEGARTAITKSPSGGIGFDWAFLVPCTWLMVGVSLDGWAHNHIPSLETFFTPWHGVLYSGYLAIAVFLLVALTRNRRRGFSWLQTLPAGYGLSLFGAGLFAIAGVLDLLWHTLFGIEKNVEALLSPTHLLLALGAILMISGPLRAAWQRSPASSALSSRDLFPMLFSLAYILAIFAFFTQFANPIANSYADQHTIEALEDLGIASILLQTALFMGGILFAMRRGRLPLGASTLIYTISSIVSSLMAKSTQVLAVAVLACVTGVFIDLLNKGLKPSSDQPVRLRLFAFVTPMVNNGMYFLGLAAVKGIAWSVHLWAGSIVMSGVVGLLLSFVALPHHWCKTMTVPFPEGFLVRPATLDDVRRVTDFLRLCQQAEYGFAIANEEGTRTLWTSPEVDLTHDTWLVFSSGELVGYLHLGHKEPLRMSVVWKVHPEYVHHGLQALLLQCAEERACQFIPLVRADARVSLSFECSGPAHLSREAGEQAGFAYVRSTLRMEIDMNEPPPVAVWPEGITLRPFTGEMAHAVYEADDEGFRDHWGYTPMSFETFRHQFLTPPSFDPTLWFLACEEEKIVGCALCESGEDMAWVNSLSVLRSWRKRGLGLALLHTAFGEFYRRGRRKVALSVDAQSLTGATRLYERAGMHLVRQFDRYEKEIRPGHEISTQVLKMS